GFPKPSALERARSVALAARGGEQLLELLEAPDERVALGRERRDLPLAERVALVLLGDPRLELRLSLVKVLQLGLEARDALLGRKVADEQHIHDQQEKSEGRKHAGPGTSRGRPVSHGHGFYQHSDFAII